MTALKRVIEKKQLPPKITSCSKASPFRASTHSKIPHLPTRATRTQTARLPSRSKSQTRRVVLWTSKHTLIAVQRIMTWRHWVLQKLKMVDRFLLRPVLWRWRQRRIKNKSITVLREVFSKLRALFSPMAKKRQNKTPPNLTNQTKINKLRVKVAPSSLHSLLGTAKSRISR